MKPRTSEDALGTCYAQQLEAQPVESQQSDALKRRVLASMFDRMLARLPSAPDRERRTQLGALIFGWDGSDTALADDLRAAIDIWTIAQGEDDPLPITLAHRLSEALDRLNAVERSGERKSSGSFFTPKSVARAVIERSLPAWEAQLEGRAWGAFSIIDPACGGGAFLIEAARATASLLQRAGDKGAGVSDEAEAYRVALRGIYGIDRSAVARSVARAAMTLLHPELHVSAERFVHGDALIDRQGHEPQKLLAALSEQGILPLDLELARRDHPRGAIEFDWVVGNPPWVAFQGRATQPISAELRAYYRARYRAFTGYPTTHGMFVERATELAPRGVISMLVPSSLSDLDGYASARAAVIQGHRVVEPLLEFGQDAFDQVVQPCFGLVAAPRSSSQASELVPTRKWRLEERTRAAAEALSIEIPACLLRFESAPVLPQVTFKELGFQSNTRVVEELFHRGDGPLEPYTLGLLEGRCVQEFRQQKPRVFLHPDEARLAELKARLRPADAYRSVDFVVRQTAAFTIAARHAGEPFRNSLLAGYASEGLDADLLVGLLNSALYRCLHVCRQRDARQATFPQVKVAHLRALPVPPSDQDARTRVRRVSLSASQKGGLSSVDRAELDQAVFQLFALNEQDQSSILEYLRNKSPKAIVPSL